MSAPNTFIRRSFVVEAMKLTEDNAKDVCDWIHSVTKAEVPVHFDLDGNVTIQTREGTMTALIGDYVVREPNPVGDRWFYPVKASIFESGYVLTESWQQYRPLSQFREHGLLWLLNRVVFHPRGFGMGIDDETGTWSVYGDGKTSMDFWSEEDHSIALRAGADPDKLPPGPVPEDDMKQRVEAFFAGLFFEAQQTD